MRQYHSLLQDILLNGKYREDRTGVGVVSVFGRQIRFNLEEGFPLLTTKYVPFKAVATELLWFISGSTNIRFLKDNGVSIWDEWADAEGELGPVYGKQWRSWATPTGETIDQLTQVIHSIAFDPGSRRHIVSAWNVADIPNMALPPCHTLFQFYVREGGYLDCQLYQRSADMFLGVPFNIASYALLTHMIASICGLSPGEFIHTFGDAHIYINHLKQVDTLLSRKEFPLPTLTLNPNIHRIQDFQLSDLELRGYEHHPAIKGDVAV